MKKSSLVIMGLMTFLICLTAQAQTHKGITFQGVIKLPDNTYPNLPGITVNAKVLSPTNCILLEEEFTSVNISNGYINLVIGKGNRTGVDPALTLSQVMDNSKIISSLICLDSNGNPTGTTSYDPSTGAGSRKFRLSISSLSVVADFNMRSMPFAINSETLNGKTDADFLKVSPTVNQTILESLISGIANIATSGSASDLTTGTVPTARLGTGTANNTTFLRGDGTWQTVTGGVSSVAGRTGDISLTLKDLKDKDGNDYFVAGLECTAGNTLRFNFADDKMECTAIAINAATHITAGTLPLSRGGTGATDAAGARTSLGLADIASSGSASDLTTGTVPTARLGTGTASASTYLRGDGTWATVSGGGVPLAFGGSDSTPDLHVSGRTNSGIYGAPGGSSINAVIGFTINGANHTEFNNEYINSYRKISTANGGVGNPHYTFMNDSDTGLYHSGSNDNTIRFTTNGTHRGHIDNSGLTIVGNIVPGTSGSGTLGTTSLRWSTAYLTNPVDVSSDIRLKEKIEASDLGLDFILALEPVSWHWKNGRGDEARHYGLIAQKTQEIIQEHSKYPHDKDSIIVGYHKESDTYGVRYSELISPVIKAIQEVVARLLGMESAQEALTAEVEQLKKQNELANAKIQQLEQNHQALWQKIEELQQRDR